jgi:hypothetical protein
MARLIDIDDARLVISPLTLQVGDVLLFKASGGHVRSGTDVVEISGPFLPAVLGDNGAIFTPMGAPNTVLFRALRTGQATLDVVTGDPWHSPHSTAVEIIVGS